MARESGIASGILTVIVVFVYTIIKNRRLPNKLEDYLVFDENFGVDESNRIDINIANMNDFINLSEKVVDFSKQHGIDDRRSMIVGLCIEEMAGNIVLHGFDEKKAYSIDARIVYKDDGLLIRIKDNCKMFNPKEVQDIFDPVDITKNVGIRLASRMAKDMSYNNSLGINVLNISV